MFEDNRRPYEAPTSYRGRNDQGSRPSDVPRGGVSTPLCNKCGILHYGSTCSGSDNKCFYCKELGHIKRFCPKLSRRLNVVHAERARNTSKIFTLSGAEVSDVDGLAQVNGSTFIVDLFCLPLSLIDLILGTDWWSAHLVMLNIADKTGAFGTLSEISDSTSCMEPVRLMEEYNVWNAKYQSWKSRLSEKGVAWPRVAHLVREILGYTEGFSLEREDPRLSESGLA
ncbi:hypothetical protein Lal_00041766 [Lupinus albus]|nr:hypothetical protein Lal_00041766 [Lupinus albus]